jgi:hypothetical protein
MHCTLYTRLYYRCPPVQCLYSHSSAAISVKKPRGPKAARGGEGGRGRGAGGDKERWGDEV